MLFNTFNFIFVFFPTVMLIFHLSSRYGNERLAIGWMVLASFFFYGSWNFYYLGLLLISIIVNYYIGKALNKHPRGWILSAGIGINLAIIAYFKYCNFFIDNLNYFSNLSFEVTPIILPLAISFYTFQQIAYLVSSYRGETGKYNFVDYSLFVSFFPQLIAGPIVNHKEVIPQFQKLGLCGIQAKNLAIGTTVFFIGLFKKVVVADGLSFYASPVFQGAEQCLNLTIFEAWGGVIAYSLQLYFDFSGYSDMALGLAKIFGITLPLNFYSPYKARSIIEFWQKWHITLSRFLKDYVYIPLGGNKVKNFQRKSLNLIITMFLGGLWHGAGWTFVLWGLLHGFYLAISHMWRISVAKAPWAKNRGQSRIWNASCVLMTFLAVTVAWVLFRSNTLGGSAELYSAMFLGNGISLPISLKGYLSSINLDLFSYAGMFPNGVFSKHREGACFILATLTFVWTAPNTVELFGHEKIALNSPKEMALRSGNIQWAPSFKWTIIIIAISVYTLMSIRGQSEFLYFQF